MSKCSFNFRTNICSQLLAKDFQIIKSKHEFLTNSRQTMYDGLKLTENNNDMINFMTIKEV